MFSCQSTLILIKLEMQITRRGDAKWNKMFSSLYFCIITQQNLNISFNRTKQRLAKERLAIIEITLCIVVAQIYQMEHFV